MEQVVKDLIDQQISGYNIGGAELAIRNSRGELSVRVPLAVILTFVVRRLGDSAQYAVARAADSIDPAGVRQVLGQFIRIAGNAATAEKTMRSVAAAGLLVLIAYRVEHGFHAEV